MIRNNTQWIIGFIDALIKTSDLTTGSEQHYFSGYDIQINFVNPERTEVIIYYHIVDQKQEEDFKTHFILVEGVTTQTGFVNLVQMAIAEIIMKIKEINE